MTDDDEKRSFLTKFTRDVLYAGLVGVVATVLSALLLSVFGVIVLLVVTGGSVPAWLAGLAVLLAVALVIEYRRRYGVVSAEINKRDRRIAELEPLESRVRELEQEITELDDDLEIAYHGLERHEVYGEHVCVVLDHLQRVMAGDIPGVTIPDFIDRGILKPAREVFLIYGKDVRLSVLLPDGDQFRMTWAAGHNLESQQKFDHRIRESLSRFALEGGVPFQWDDVHDDPHFQPNPHATRPFHSMVSLPIMVGGTTRGVFNTISDVIGDFDPADINYITSLGSVIDVAVGIFVKELATPGGNGRSVK